MAGTGKDGLFRCFVINLCETRRDAKVGVVELNYFLAVS